MLSGDLPQDCNAHGFLRCKVLEVLDQPRPFELVVLGGPVVVQVIHDLDAAVKFVEEAGVEHPGSSQGLDRIQHPTGQDILKPRLGASQNFRSLSHDLRGRDE